MSCVAVIVAAGSGKRAGELLPKQFCPLNGRAVLWHAVQPFLRHPLVDEVRVIVADNDAALLAGDILSGLAVVILPHGGKNRAQTVANGIADCADDDWILSHDAARPCLNDDMLERLITRVMGDSVGGILALPVSDALKEGGDGRVLRTLSRAGKWLAQTPQMFRAEPLRTALAKFPDAADESEAMVGAGFSPLLIEGAASNMKITVAEDFAAAALLAAVPR